MKNLTAPAYRITLQGQDITPKLRPLLLSLTLTDCRGTEADQLDLELMADAKLQMPRTGVTLTLALGWQGEALVEKGEFIVDEVAHGGPPDTLTLHARSADFGLNFRTAWDQSWHQTTLGDVLQTIAARNGLSPRIDARVAAIPIEHIDQTHESDAAFITRLAARFDAICTVKRGRLLFLPANFTRTTATGSGTATATAPKFTGVRTWWRNARKVKHSALAGQAGHVYRVTTPVHDSQAAAQQAADSLWATISAAQATGSQQTSPAQPATNTATTTAPEAETNLPTIEITRADGDRHHYTASDRNAYSGVRAYWHDPARATRRGVMVGLSGNAKHLKETFATEADALAAAQAEWQRIERGAATFELTLALGRPDALAASPVAVEGFHPAIDGTDWVATRVTHRITEGAGYTTHIEAEILGTRRESDAEAQPPQDAAEQVEPGE